MIVFVIGAWRVRLVFGCPVVRSRGRIRMITASKGGDMKMRVSNSGGAAGWLFAKSIGIAASAALATAHSAYAGSIGANTGTYAGDVAGIEFPVGTVAVTNYFGYRHQSTLYDTGGASSYASFNVLTGTTRVDWRAADVFGRPLGVSFAGNYVNPRDVTIAGTDNSAVTTWFAPTVYVTLGLIADASHERDLAFTNYVIFGAGKYDSTKFVNVATPGQTVDVVQLTYQEGLRKFSPALKNFWFDAFGGIAFHSDGKNPITLGVDPVLGPIGFSKTTQSNSYDINAYIRYAWSELGFVALGLEKSWGGEQRAVGGLGELLNPAGPGSLSLSKDDYLKGHLQFGIPLGDRMQLAADLTHDFQRIGGFKESFTAEFRLLMLFAPAGTDDKPADTGNKTRKF